MNNEPILKAVKGIGDRITDEREFVEKSVAELGDRIDILEAANDRPTKSGVDDDHSITLEQKEYGQEFAAWLRKSHDKHYEKRLTEAAHDLSKKDVSIGTPTSGGHAVPEQLSRDIRRMVNELNPLRNFVRVDSCGTGDYKILLDKNNATANWSSESGSRSATNSPELRQIEPTFGEQYALVSASEWALDDVFFDVQEWLVMSAANQFSDGELEAVVNGDGSNKPTGFLNATPVTTADSASPERAAAAIQYIPTDSASPQAAGYDDVVDLVHSLQSKYLRDRSCAFFAHRTTIAELRKIKDSQGNPIWQASAQAQTPDLLLGYPMVTVDSMPTYASDTHYLAFGAWQQGYTLCDRVGIRVLADPYTTPGTVRFYIRRRLGGHVVNNDAIKVLKLADS